MSGKSASKKEDSKETNDVAEFFEDRIVVDDSVVVDEHAHSRFLRFMAQHLYRLSSDGSGREGKVGKRKEGGWRREGSKRSEDNTLLPRQMVLSQSEYSSLIIYLRPLPLVGWVSISDADKY